MKIIRKKTNRLFVSSLHLVGAAAVGLLVVVFCVLVYWPLEGRQADAVTRVGQLDALLLRAGSEGREYRGLRDKLASLETLVAETQAELTVENSETTVLERLNKIATDFELVVEDYEVGQTKRLMTHQETNVEFRCLGSYASICRFLEVAEKLTKTTKLAKFELNESKNFDGYPIQLTFVLYSRGESHDTKEKRGVL